MADIKKELGFTLVEMVIVIAILIILTSFAIPSFNTMIENSRIRTAAESISNGLQVTRAEAVKRNQNIQLELAVGASSWNVCPQPSPAGACNATAIIHSRNQNDGSSVNVTVVPSGGLSGPYVFNSLGQMVSPASAVQIDIDNSALSAADSRNLRVLVEVGGAVKTCDPTLDSSGNDLRRCP